MLAAAPLRLTFTTAIDSNPMRSVVVGRRFAVGDPTGTTAPIVMVGAHIDSVLDAPGAYYDASVTASRWRSPASCPSCRSTRRSGSAASAARRTG